MSLDVVDVSSGSSKSFLLIVCFSNVLCCHTSVLLYYTPTSQEQVGKLLTETQQRCGLARSAPELCSNAWIEYFTSLLFPFGHLGSKIVFETSALGFPLCSTRGDGKTRFSLVLMLYIYIYYFYFVFIPLFLPNIAQMKESLSFCLWNFDFAWTSFWSFHFFVLFCVGVCYPQLDMSNGFCDVPYWCAESESIGSFVPVVHVLLRGLLSLLQKDDLLQGAFGTQANFPYIYHLWCLGWKQPTISKCLICVSATGKPHPKTTFSPPKSG